MAHPDREPRPEVDRAHEVGKMASGKERSWPHRDIRLTRSKSGAHHHWIQSWILSSRMRVNDAAWAFPRQCFRLIRP